MLNIFGQQINIFLGKGNCKALNFFY